MSKRGHGGNVWALAAKLGVDPDAVLDFSANINPLGPPAWLRSVVGGAISDVVHTLAELAVRDDAPPEVELGGADVLTYREMMVRYADVAGLRQRPIIKVPVLTPRLSSYWVGLVTPIESGLARPLVEGLSAEMLVKQAPPPGLNDHPKGFEEAVRAALDLDR